MTSQLSDRLSNGIYNATYRLTVWGRQGGKVKGQARVIKVKAEVRNKSEGETSVCFKGCGKHWLADEQMATDNLALEG